MKKSEFKEYLKTEILKMNEASIEVDSAEKAKEVADEMPDAEIKYKTNEGKITKSEFKEYLRNEILREINEQEEDDFEDIGDVDVTDQVDFDVDPTEESDADELDTLSDDLVDLAKKAKNAGAIELANQILNSAKFANKTKIKSAEKQAGLDQEG
jgi:hypothetical protein